MTDRMFRMLERHQKLDVLLGLARTRRHADLAEIERLKTRKKRLRDRLTRLLSPVVASVSL